MQGSGEWGWGGGGGAGLTTVHRGPSFRSIVIRMRVPVIKTTD